MGGEYFGATDEFYLDITVNCDGSFSGIGGMYLGISPITCFSGVCTWYCAWIDSSDNKLPVSGTINDEAGTGIIRIEGFEGEQLFTVTQDKDKAGKITLDLSNDDWGIKKFVIYNTDMDDTESIDI